MKVHWVAHQNTEFNKEKDLYYYAQKTEKMVENVQAISVVAIYKAAHWMMMILTSLIFVGSRRGKEVGKWKNGPVLNCIIRVHTLLLQTMQSVCKVDICNSSKDSWLRFKKKSHEN